MFRRILVLSIVVLGAYILTTVAYRYIQNARIPQWKKEIGAVLHLEVVEDSKFSLQYIEDYNRMNDLLHVKNWSESEVSELLRFVDIPQIRDEQVTDTDEFDIELLEIWLRRSDALGVMSERFGVDAPIDEDQRQVIIDALTAGLYQTTSYRYFNFTVADVMRAGLADTPGPIRDQILYIYIHPKQFFGNNGLGVAENIKRQLKSRGVFILEGETHQ